MLDDVMAGACCEHADAIAAMTHWLSLLSVALPQQQQPAAEERAKMRPPPPPCRSSAQPHQKRLPLPKEPTEGPTAGNHTTEPLSHTLWGTRPRHFTQEPPPLATAAPTRCCSTGGCRSAHPGNRAGPRRQPMGELETAWVGGLDCVYLP